MNLRIIIDKSLFQSLPTKAFTPLDKYFEVIIPPILIKEILGDLATRKDVDKERFVANLADRFGVNSIVCHDYRFLLINSLLGFETPVDGRIVAAGLTAVEARDGTLGFKVSDTFEDNALRRWQRGDFSIGEAFWAYRWQSIRKFISSNLYFNKLKEWGITLPHLKSLEQLNEVVEEILSNPRIQGRLLGLINREFQLSWNIQVRVVNRWFELKRPLLKDFAPYAAYCLKANLLLVIGKSNETILGGRHEHDLRDLEYCYYLPFCQIFASVDKIHKKLIRLLKRENQSFVSGEFSEELKKLGEEWFSFTKEEKITYLAKYGSRPAPNPDSTIIRLLKEYGTENYRINKPGKPIIGKGIKLPDVVPPLDKGKNESFPVFLKQLMNKVKDAELTRKSVNSIEDGSFLVHKTLVSKKKIQELYPHIDFDEDV